MTRFPFLSTAQWLVVLRVVIALYMTAHGATRAAVGTVDDFGGFLTAQGLPFGLLVAWGITLNEIVGGILLASGRLVRPLAALFALEHLVGIVLVHAPRGWFTVGHQVGGAEYSVLLLLCFLLTASTAARQDSLRRLHHRLHDLERDQRDDDQLEQVAPAHVDLGRE